MKYPQEKDIYLGVITEEGIKKPKSIANEYKTYEYGISMYLLKIAEEKIKEYGDKVKVRAILSIINGVKIFDYHYRNSYLSIIYPNIKIDYLHPVDKELSHIIVRNINNYEYGLLYGITAIKIDNKWELSNLSDEAKEVLKKYNIKTELN